MTQLTTALTIVALTVALVGSSVVAAVPWTTFSDPAEGAFSIDVPDGWQVTGGLNRVAAVDLRPAVRAVAPNGSITLFFGDPQLPTFVAPNQMMASMGFSEGSSYSPGYGVMMQVRRYMPGEQLAEWWVRNRFPGAHTNAAHRLADASARMSQAWAAFQSSGMLARVDVGEVAFTAQGQRGGVVAGTLYMQTSGMVTWRAEHLAGYLASPDQEAVARQLVERMVGSYRLSPQWVAMQHGLTANVSDIVAATSDALSESLRESWARRQAAQDRIAQQRSNAMLGVEQWRDPVTGDGLEVEAGWEHYWIDPSGQVVGTRTDEPPGRFFRPLEPADR
jgi:hypothetical protein